MGVRDAAYGKARRRPGSVSDRFSKQGCFLRRIDAHDEAVGRKNVRVRPDGSENNKGSCARGAGMDLEARLELEKSLVEYLQGTEDFDEGIRAFTEKRNPNYKAQ